MSKSVHAFCDDVLSDHDGVALARLVRKGEVSPAELVRAAIARAEYADPGLAGIAHADFERASNEAEAPLEGPFAGVPTFIKDTTDLRGAPTRLGSQATGARLAKADAAFTKLVRGQGMVIVGKTKLPELGLNATTEPAGGTPTRNPWNTDYSSGGSSGGSAALVAAGVVPIAHGNDGGGSLRIPAACCGLFALKPTRGRVPPNEAARQLPINIVSDGVITRSVRDSAHFYAEVERQYPCRKLPPIGLVEGPGKRQLRVGLALDSIGVDPTDAPTRAAVLDAARLLQSHGHAVEEVEIPDEALSLPEDFIVYWAMLAYFSTAFGKLTVSSDFDASRVEPLTRGLADYFKRRMWQLPGVLWRLSRSPGVYARTLSDFDVLLTPVVGHTTPKLGHLSPEVDFKTLLPRLRNFVAFSPLNNATGSPAMSVPLGTTEDGRPIGVHFAGRHGDERTLLELAHELEQERPFRRIHDGMGQPTAGGG